MKWANFLCHILLPPWYSALSQNSGPRWPCTGTLEPSAEINLSSKLFLLGICHRNKRKNKHRIEPYFKFQMKCFFPFPLDPGIQVLFVMLDM
jgi:hypothetical protein